MTRLAILDDEERMAEVLAMVLRRAGHEVVTHHHPRALLEALDDESYDLLLTDLKMPDIDGLEVLRRVKARFPEMPVVLLTAHGTVSTAVAAMKEGAYDYLEKPVDNDACRAVVARALELTRLSRENRYLRRHVRQELGLHEIVAESDAMKRVLDLVARAARSTATVVVSGESGTGKEVVARAIHVESDRVAEPFLAVNCKAFASGVLESELFGHEKGAFTGAQSARAGVFERAEGGTLFLDEIGEVGDDFQAKLLRVVQEREVQRVGADQAKPFDVRIVSATNRDLQDEVAAGRFREDLYFRLAVIPIHIPPLRDRRKDVLPLARSFFMRLCRDHGRRVAGWTDEVTDWLVSHDWPGNVRELENTLERGVVLCRGDRIELDDLVLPVRRAHEEGPLPLQAHLDRAAKARIEEALEAARGVRVEAAAALGVERTTLYRLMKRYGIG